MRFFFFPVLALLLSCEGNRNSTPEEVISEHNKNISAIRDIFLNDIQKIYSDYKMDSSSFLLYCSVKDQEMFLCSYSTIINTYAVSTAKKGIGNKTGSEQTPLGLHEITDVVCKDCLVGTIIRNKKNTGQTAKIFTDSTDNVEDFVLTRAIILKGMEEGKNKGGDVDSYKRVILIHGTNEEGLLGKPSSHGCIRMKNIDVIELANEILKGKFYLFIAEE